MADIKGGSAKPLNALSDKNGRDIHGSSHTMRIFHSETCLVGLYIRLPLQTNVWTDVRYFHTGIPVLSRVNS